MSRKLVTKGALIAAVNAAIEARGFENCAITLVHVHPEKPDSSGCNWRFFAGFWVGDPKSSDDLLPMECRELVEEVVRQFKKTHNLK